jgi:hypothetical protein
MRRLPSTLPGVVAMTAVPAPRADERAARTNENECAPRTNENECAARTNEPDARANQRDALRSAHHRSAKERHLRGAKGDYGRLDPPRLPGRGGDRRVASLFRS